MPGSAAAPAKAPEPVTKDKELAAMRAAHDALGKRLDEWDNEKKDAKKDGEEGGEGATEAMDNKKDADGEVEGAGEGGDKGGDDRPKPLADDKKDAKKDQDLEKWAAEEKAEPEHKGDGKKDGELPAALKENQFGKDGKKDAEGDTDPNLDATGKRGDARADSIATLQATVRQQQAQIARLTGHITRSDADVDALSELHTEWNRIAQAHGTTASRPMYGETSNDYDRRLAKQWQKHSDKWKGHKLDDLPPTVVSGIAAPEIRADSLKAAYRNEPGAEGELREIIETDRTGRRISKFIGPISATLAPFRMPPMRVRRINTQPSPY